MTKIIDENEPTDDEIRAFLKAAPGCDVCGAHSVSHAQGVRQWCAVHAPEGAHPIPRAPHDPQPRAKGPPYAATCIPEVGDVVLYTLPNGPRAGEERPAIVTRLLGRSSPGLWMPIAIHVFCAGGDGLEAHRTEAGYSAEPLAGHWRWSGLHNPSAHPSSRAESRLRWGTK